MGALICLPRSVIDAIAGHIQEVRKPEYYSELLRVMFPQGNPWEQPDWILTKSNPDQDAHAVRYNGPEMVFFADWSNDAKTAPRLIWVYHCIVTS